MIDPKRLSDTTDSGVERALLRAGRARAPKGAKARALLVASGALTASSLAGAGAAAEGATFTTKVATTIALKWIGSLGVAGVVAVTSAVALRSASVSQEVSREKAVVVPRVFATAASSSPKAHERQPPTAATPTAEAPAVSPPQSPLKDAPVVSAREPAPMDDPAAHLAASGSPHTSTAPLVEPPRPPAEVPATTNPSRSEFFAHLPTARTATPLAATLARDSPSAPNPTFAPAGAAESVSPLASTLHAEIDLLHAARAALSAGDRPRALELLASYEAQFVPGGVMRPEEAVLRIEALVASGDRLAADRVARAFLARNPSSPYAPRVKRLLSQSNP